jgi:hypothetical protein
VQGHAEAERMKEGKEAIEREQERERVLRVGMSKVSFEVQTTREEKAKAKARAGAETKASAATDKAAAEKAAAATDAKVVILANIAQYVCLCSKSTVCFQQVESIEMETMLKPCVVSLSKIVRCRKICCPKCG